MAGAVGFWSYVHSDDKGDGGRIRQLAQQLKDEYRMLTADALELFVDRESLLWGDEWEQRINDAIGGTTFFIPIITPSYFSSQACRTELLKFSAQASRLGLDELILPAYWIAVPELDLDPDGESDEAMTLIRKYEWFDLRDVRLKDADSSDFRTAVNGLAKALVKRALTAETVRDVPLPRSGTQTREGATDEVDDDALGLLDVLAQSDEATTEATETMTALAVEIERIGTVMSSATEWVNSLVAKGDNLKARLVVTERLAQELGEPAERIEELGHQFASQLVAIDAGMLTYIDLAAEADPPDPAVQEQILEQARDLAAAAEPSVAALSEMTRAADDIAKLSRSLRRPLSRMRRGLQGVIDGKVIIDGWALRAEAKLGDSIIES